MTSTALHAQHPVSRETLLAQLEWRYATKKFDPARKIPAEDWAALERALVLSPSSYGLQPWRFVVVTNPLMREKLRAVSQGQRQVTDASHLVAFAIRKGLDRTHVRRHVERIGQVRGVSPESLAGFSQKMEGHVARTDIDLDDWAARQTYLALGTFLTSAAVLGIDACPMEGIESGRYDEILDLRERGFATVCAAAAGYRSPEDPYAKVAKVRFEHEHVIERVV